MKKTITLLRKSRFTKPLLLTAMLIGGLAYSKPNFPPPSFLPTNTQTEKPLALVVDDSESVRKRVKDYLGEKGYQVLTAKTLEQAKESIRNQKIERVITDMDLTKSSDSGFFKYLSHRTDGLKLLEWVHEQKRQGDCPYLEQIILHSTIFNNRDTSGFLVRPYTKYVQVKIEQMNKETPIYSLQPKTEILK